MAQKCVHKGCGKVFSDPDEPCIYHPGPPEFHEGQKGWKCCNKRVLTFDEFLQIPPCTTGKHSTVDDAPLPESKPMPTQDDLPAPKPIPHETTLAQHSDKAVPAPAPRIPQSSAAAAAAAGSSRAPQSPAPPESESDEPSANIPPGKTCRRRGCNATSGEQSADTPCTYHPGQALFHEGSKGWTCCKKRVLEFDEFMRIPGCKTREKHCFLGKPKKKKPAPSVDPTPLANGTSVENSATAADSNNNHAEGDGNNDEEDDDVERLITVRNDFYQTSSTIHASFYLKRIDKERSQIVFRESGTELELSLRTADDKLYKAVVPFFAKIVPEKSNYKILGTKLELELAKVEPLGWPVLRSDEQHTGEIIQTGRAGVA